MQKLRSRQTGFTIVELLIVIVVIGILAAITIVAYNGIQGRAVASSLTSDLNGAAKRLKLYQVENNGYPAANDCSVNPAVPPNICLKPSSGNTYTDFQINNATNPQTICLTVRNTNGANYRIVNDSAPVIGTCSDTSCLFILNAGGSTGNGMYWIKPAGTFFQAYCDMDNGGWTRLNNNIATSTTLFDSSDVLITNNIPGACGSPGCAFTINNILVGHTNVRANLTRTTSIVQCASLLGASAGSSYWNGSAWIGFGMCNWNDGIFANATNTDMTGLKLLWKLEGPKAANGEIKLISSCSGASDNGQIQITSWVK